MIDIFLLAFALSMDAFAVSIGLGIKKRVDIKLLAFKAGLFFGIFQAVMPLIGYLGEVGLKEYIQGYDKLIAFAFLLIIGLKMIYESFGENVEEEISIISNKVLLTLAIATSIDAMAAGFSLHLFDLTPVLSLIIIGLVTFLMTILGVYIGSKGGSRYESSAEFIGGAILIFVGLKLLIF